MGDGSGLIGIVGATGGISILPPILSTTLLSTGLLTARNISATTISTTYGFFSTISAGAIYARFIGDGSQLTGISGTFAVPPILSTNILSTGILTASNISTISFSTGRGFASSFGINNLTTSTTFGLPVTSNAIQPTTDGSDYYLTMFNEDADSLLFATFFGGTASQDHVDGGTSRFDKKGIVYQAVCAGCGGNGFPIKPSSTASSTVLNFIKNTLFSIVFIK